MTAPDLNRSAAPLDRPVVVMCGSLVHPEVETEAMYVRFADVMDALDGEQRQNLAEVVGEALMPVGSDVMHERLTVAVLQALCPRDWRCECGDLNREHEVFCFRCGAGHPGGGRPWLT